MDISNQVAELSSLFLFNDDVPEELRHQVASITEDLNILSRSDVESLDSLELEIQKLSELLLISNKFLLSLSVKKVSSVKLSELLGTLAELNKLTLEIQNELYKILRDLRFNSKRSLFSVV